MKKEDGKWKVSLSPKLIDEEVVKKEIENMLPKGFSFKEGLFNSEKPSYGIWEQKTPFGRSTIHCEVTRGVQDDERPDGMRVYYRFSYINLWCTVESFWDRTFGKERKLDKVCINIAKMIEDKYKK